MELRFEIRKNNFPKGAALMRKAVGTAFASQKPILLADTQRRTPIDTGELRNSESAESDEESLTLRATAGHALFVHAGARGVPPRPFIRDAVEAAIPSLVDAIAAEADRALA